MNTEFAVWLYGVGECVNYIVYSVIIRRTDTICIFRLSLSSDIICAYTVTELTIFCKGHKICQTDVKFY